ncbi:solute carrier family 25 member 47-B isoform X2 [Chiloscyllium plagiosum]|uniref:solute carrier family 25 member 47-B isoform X2 n=1 Tax=Chiloscyllium plagiosum TaxID=36176 RepID=UPI001CB87DFC|nr:solute carrier family 25 member 47-B isoform X2 [Chiloscyllium plagiosum]
MFNIHWCEIYIATTGGLATAVGYPLDTIKVRIQTQHMYSGIWHCIRSTYQREKVYGFYKGMALPVLSVSVCGSVCFGTYRNCLHFLSQLRHGSSDVKPSRFDVFIAGCSAGTAEAMVFAPIDLIKIRQQNQTHPHQSYQGPPSRDLLLKPKYRGPTHCLITVIKEEGILGLYRGITALWLRDIPCFGLYFLVYSVFTEWLTPQGQHKPDWSAMLLAGGCAGMTYWTLATPMDVMKSRMQMDGMGQQRYNGVLNCINESFRQEGARVFFKGLSLNCVRAFPVNGLTFVIYETVLAFLKKINAKD